ncbi:hypothetical protein SUGI_0917580 [Cryptomeria japonica]|nr:hypothetical protein SUGI_0917580 [Cryptomeria japonica]
MISVEAPQQKYKLNLAEIRFLLQTLKSRYSSPYPIQPNNRTDRQITSEACFSHRSQTDYSASWRRNRGLLLSEIRNNRSVSNSVSGRRCRGGFHNNESLLVPNNKPSITIYKKTVNLSDAERVIFILCESC